MTKKQRFLFNFFIFFALINLSCEAYYSAVSVDNYHKVSKTLYRSAQPNAKDMKDLEKHGIKSILNLRHRIDDQKEIKGTNLKEFHIPIRTKKITYANMLNAMRTYNEIEKPVLVHCRRGSDRTGCFVACYLIANGASKEEAIEVLLDDKFGYYQNLFPNILSFIEQLDVVQFRNDLINKK